jgi:tetratricopeptide (TPR) repeat protein
MQKSIVVAIILMAVFATGLSLFAPAAIASGSGGGSVASAPPIEARPKSPEQQAEVAYNKGLKHKKRAWAAEKKAANASNDKKRAKHLKRATKEYKKAQGFLGEALRQIPEHYKAANELGYALRKTGDYKNAIGAYNHALNIHPGFLQAVEYRGEALMALGYFDKTREAYLQLFREDRNLAAELMTAMQTWAASKTDAGARERNFIEWIAERKKLGVLGETAGTSGSGW